MNFYLWVLGQIYTLLTNICCDFLFFLRQNPETPKALHHMSGSNRKDRSHACYAHNTSVSSQYSNPLGVIKAIIQGPWGVQGVILSLFTIGPFRITKPTITPDILFTKTTQHIIGNKPLPDTMFASKLCCTKQLREKASASKQENWCQI